MGVASSRRGDAVIARQFAAVREEIALRQPRPMPHASTAVYPAKVVAPSRTSIVRWMAIHADEYRDGRTGEVNTTALVEAWDSACADGGATLDSDHIAWDVAVRFAL